MLPMQSWEELDGSKPGMKRSRVVTVRVLCKMPVSPRFRAAHSSAQAKATKGLLSAQAARPYTNINGGER